MLSELKEYCATDNYDDKEMVMRIIIGDNYSRNYGNSWNFN